MRILEGVHSFLSHFLILRFFYSLIILELNVPQKIIWGRPKVQPFGVLSAARQAALYFNWLSLHIQSQNTAAWCTREETK